MKSGHRLGALSLNWTAYCRIPHRSECFLSITACCLLLGTMMLEAQ